MLAGEIVKGASSASSASSAADTDVGNAVSR